MAPRAVVTQRVCHRNSLRHDGRCACSSPTRRLHHAHGDRLAVGAVENVERDYLGAFGRSHALSVRRSNGRGTFYKAVKFALADCSGVAGPDLFVERHGAHPAGEMTLRGMRLAVMSESGRTYHRQGAR